MKRFHFQLEPVLDYKQQVLDNLMSELSAVQERVRVQEGRRAAAERKLKDYETEYAQRKEEGMTIVEALECESCQQVLHQQLQREETVLQELRRRAEAKRLEVVEARKGTFTLEKLRDIRRKEYDNAAAKAEERFIEDLTASRRAAAS